MEMIHGFHVRRTWTRDDTAQVIVDLHDWFGKEFSEHAEQRHYDRPTDGSLMPVNLAGKMAREIDGFGWTKGRAAGRLFKSPLRMATAALEAWQEIPGVGKKLAERAWKAMRDEG